MKTYVLIVSTTFPTTHYKAGQTTDFVQKIADCVKLHTIRQNYSLWVKRAEQINAGKARLSVRIWTGLPYKSTQREVLEFTSIGVEKLNIRNITALINDKNIGLSISRIAENDGLSLSEFIDWFKCHLENPQSFAIIHFTTLRYGKENV